MSKTHQQERDELKARRKAERKERVNGAVSQVGKVSYRLAVLSLAGVLIFAGVMSLVEADAVVKYALATVVTLFIAKDLY